jgi:hypothetical protein
MKKLINTIVEDSCANCPYMNGDNIDCEHPNASQSDLINYCKMDGGYFADPLFVAIPNWCPLETVEE